MAQGVAGRQGCGYLEMYLSQILLETTYCSNYCSSYGLVVTYAYLVLRTTAAGLVTYAYSAAYCSNYLLLRFWGTGSSEQK